MTYLSALWRQLKHRSIVPEMKAGLWMIVEAIKNRNYLHGYDIYMRLAVGRRCNLLIIGLLFLSLWATMCAYEAACQCAIRFAHASNISPDWSNRCNICCCRLDVATNC